MVGIDNIRRAIAAPWVPPHIGKAPYLWVSSLGYFLWKYLYVPPSALELACLAASVLLFLPLYFGSFWVRGQRAVLIILVTCLLGALWAPDNFGACSFFIFACAMCARIDPPRWAYAMLASVLAVATATATLLDNPPLSFIIPTLVAGIPVGVASIMETSLRRSRDKLLRKQEEVEHLATIAERERISRDLHDLLGHTLSLITLKAELAGKLVTRDAAACARELRDIENSARHTLAEVRSAVTGYRQTGFTHELANARASLAAAGIEMNVRVQPFTLPAAAENVMSLALREGVTNIVRHARATHCDVDLALDARMIVLRIRDNGTALANAAALRHGNGLAGMSERVSALGGRLALKVERGLALELSLPMGAAG
jgi:two-component system sensor histidine kinase DesK